MKMTTQKQQESQDLHVVFPEWIMGGEEGSEHETSREGGSLRFREVRMVGHWLIEEGLHFNPVLATK
jgi:hypothetical protein